MTAINAPQRVKQLEFRGGWGMAFVPLIAFIVTCVLYFTLFQTFDSYALVAGGFVGLLLGALLAKNYASFWSAVFKGLGSPTAATIVVMLLVVGMYSELIKVSGLSEGIVWLVSVLNIGGEWYVLFVFLATCLISSSTGSSIGAMVTAFPVFYAAGIPLGVSTVLMGGAIVSGALFGDNLAPISDTTIISASSQRFRRKTGSADIGGVVSSRARFALLSAAISAVVFTALGFVGAPEVTAEVTGSPTGLWMLIPVVAMLVVAFVTRDIFAAATTGLIVGTGVALLTGVLTPAGIAGVQDGASTGFLINGITGMIPTVALVLTVFAMMGVLIEAGVLTKISTALLAGRWTSTPRGTEAIIAASISVLTVGFSGVNGAAMLTLGPVVDELGAKVDLHPYRRSNVMDCFAMGLSSIIPFVSVFLFIASGLTIGFDAAPLSPVDLFPVSVYPLVLTVVMIFSVVSGWGRRFEGPDGVPMRERPVAS